ncbi:hypothetical protein D1007_35964 [Hordeum vulgare]|nr:hypothetical protein D1007_35964 [Hordeum vulgare]
MASTALEQLDCERWLVRRRHDTPPHTPFVLLGMVAILVARGGASRDPAVCVRACRVLQYRALVAKAKATARRTGIRAARKRTATWKSIQRQLVCATVSCNGLHRWIPCGGEGAS